MLSGLELLAMSSKSKPGVQTLKNERKKKAKAPFKKRSISINRSMESILIALVIII